MKHLLKIITYYHDYTMTIFKHYLFANNKCIKLGPRMCSWHVSYHIRVLIFYPTKNTTKPKKLPTCEQFSFRLCRALYHIDTRYDTIEPGYQSFLFDNKVIRVSVQGMFTHLMNG